jgi:hypothetical protein
MTPRALTLVASTLGPCACQPANAARSVSQVDRGEVCGGQALGGSWSSCPPRVHDREGQQAWAQKQNLRSVREHVAGACRSSEDGDTIPRALFGGSETALS